MMLLNLLLLFMSLNNGAKESTRDDYDKGLKILFVGNSLTYTNDLPALVTEIGKQDGKKITSHSILFANYSLEDHWNEGKVKTEIEKGSYDFVVAQQGPSALPESRVLLLEYADRFAKLCRENNSKLALYMVWPSRTRLFDLDSVIYSYTYTAKKTGSLLCPAGLSWKHVWETDPSFPLYGPDGFHPGMEGSLLAALTIYGVLANKKKFDFIWHGTSSWKGEIDENKFSILKKAAARAVD